VEAPAGTHGRGNMGGPFVRHVRDTKCAMLLALSCMCALAAGYAATLWLWPKAMVSAGDDPLGALERIVAASLLALTLGVAISATLATIHRLDRGPLVWAFGLVAPIGILELRRHAPWRSRRAVDISRAEILAVVPGLAALLAWIAFVVWRSFVVFVMVHDALSYHMPRAMMLVRAHGYSPVVAPDVRLSWPANYELLLADVILLTGSDRACGLVGIGAWVWLLVTVAAITERWWGRGPHVLTVVLVTAAAPVMLVIAGAHKNDALSATLFLVSIHFGARWLARPRAASYVLACLALALAVGTKAHFPALGLALVGMLALAGLRARKSGERPTLGRLLGWASLPVVASLVLGGQVYLVNLAATGRPLPLLLGSSAPPRWRYPFEFLYLMAMAPFSPRWPDDVWCAWTHSYWFLPTYDLFFSNFGALAVVLGVGVCFGAWRYARRNDCMSERVAASLGIVVAMTALMLIPFRAPPAFFAFPRFALALAPLAPLWTIGPLQAELWRSGRAGRLGAFALAFGATGHFAYQAVRAAKLDRYEPLSFVLDVVDHPDLSRQIVDFPSRAASVVDRIAGPDDSIAFDGDDFDSWIYPAYGRELRRKVTLLPAGPEPVAIPDDAKWVLVDRNWTCWFGDPEFTDLGQWRDHIGRGRPTPEELRVVRQLGNDPRFVLRYHDTSYNQVIFERVTQLADH
jgi:hypothetical protein